MAELLPRNAASAGARAEAAPTEARLIHLDKEERSASFAAPLNGAVSVALALDEEFVVTDSICAVATSVAAATCRNDVVRAVNQRIAQVIGDDGRDVVAFQPNHPVDLASAPMTSVWPGADLFVQDGAGLCDDATLVRERVVGGAAHASSSGAFLLGRGHPAMIAEAVS